MVQFTITSGGYTKTIAYFITTWPSSVTLWTSTGWTLNYVKCKYYAYFSVIGYFFYTDTNVEVATNSFSASYCNSYTSGVTGPNVMYFTQNYIVSDGTPVTYVSEIDFTPTITSLTNFGFRNGDSMVLSITHFNVYWGTISSCNALGGLSSTSMNQVLTCVVRNTSNIYITNIGSFLTDPLLGPTTNYRVKYSFVANGAVNAANVFMKYYIVLYSNLDACLNGYQGIFNVVDANGLWASCYFADPNLNCYWGQSPSLGTFLLQKVTDTYMQVVFAPATNLVFGGTTSYVHTFLIMLNPFNYGTTCTISNVIFEMSTATTPGSGFNNTSPITSVACNSGYLSFTFSGLAFSSYWGGLGPASDGTWQTNEYLIFYLTISPDPSQRDLPSLHH